MVNLLKLTSKGKKLPVVADLSICHPFSGGGQWKRDAAQVRVKEKIKKHSAHMLPTLTSKHILHRLWQRHMEGSRMIS